MQFPPKTTAALQYEILKHLTRPTLPNDPGTTVPAIDHMIGCYRTPRLGLAMKGREPSGGPDVYPRGLTPS
jgi:hypothetical protein